MAKGRHRGQRKRFFHQETRFMFSVLGVCYGWGLLLTGGLAQWDCSHRTTNLCAAGYTSRGLSYLVPAAILAFVGTRGMIRYFRSYK